MRPFIVLVPLCLTLLAGAARAEAGPAEVPEILKAVLRLEGKWEAETARMGGVDQPFKYVMHFRKTAAGSGLYMDESAAIAGAGELAGANLIGYDPYGGRLHWFSVDNFGTAHDHVGEMLGKDRLRFTHDSMRDGKRYHESFDIQWESAEKARIQLVATMDGETVETLEGTFTRTAMN